MSPFSANACSSLSRRRFLLAGLGLAWLVLSGLQAGTPDIRSERSVLKKYSGPSVEGVDTGTLDGKVMAGYQGWFNCEGDGADLGWTHWGRTKSRPLGPGNVTVDLWPDVSELGEDELFDTGFQNADGSPARVFSSYKRATVLRHFEWMRDYGIDGAFVQRFANGLRERDKRHHKNVVLSNAREGANRAGRSYAVMYDLSGLPKGGTALVKKDWNMLQRKMKITKDPAYQKHNGKPLVTVWGIGFSSRENPREYTLEECRSLVDFLKKQGCSVMIGTPTGWRGLDRDAVSDPEFHELLKAADIVSPWTPGRYKTPDAVSAHAQKYWAPDIQWCEENGLDYLPVLFPGFSWHNLKGDALGAIPRLKGQFLWQQVVSTQEAGAKMLYIAMFDEVDEGTAIFKVTNAYPKSDVNPFLDYEGLPSDYYLYLAGQAGKTLRGEAPLSPTPPVRPGLDVAEVAAEAAP